MRHLRKYSALFLTMLFCCYYLSISIFSHTHIVNGASIVHSHLGGGSEHNHNEGQYVVIALLSDFQSEGAVYCSQIEAPCFLLSELYIAQNVTPDLDDVLAVDSLRGPPQA